MFWAAIAEQDLDLTVVKAPSDGQVIKINTYPGELVSDDGIIEFADTKNMMVVAEVYESDIGKVKIGQTARITSETGAFEEEISGEVKRVGMKVSKQDVLEYFGSRRDGFTPVNDRQSCSYGTDFNGSDVWCFGKYCSKKIERSRSRRYFLVDCLSCRLV